MTRNELQEQILWYMGNRDVDSVTTSDGTILVHQWIGFALRLIARLHRFKELDVVNTSLQITADTLYTNLPSNVRTIKNVWLIDGTESKKLGYKNPSWIDRWYPNPTAFSTTKPVYYTRRGNVDRMEFVPLSDATYSLSCYFAMWPETLSLGSSEPEFSGLDDVIVAFGAGYGFSYLGKGYSEDMAMAFKNGNDLLQIAVDVEKDVPDEIHVAMGYSTQPRSHGGALPEGSFPSGTTNPF